MREQDGIDGGITDRWVPMKRGQLFSTDLIIAVAILAVALGAVMQHTEFTQREAADRIEYSSPRAPVLAEAIAYKRSFIRIPHCAKYSNDTEACSGVTCTPDTCAQFDSSVCPGYGGRVFVSQRLTNCTVSGSESFCLLEVHTCQ